MHASEQILKAHQQLQLLFGANNPALLGGSYLYGEARAHSDVDFYVVCSWKVFFGFRRYDGNLAGIRKTIAPLKMTVMLIPKWFFKRGWYYIYGQDVKGRVHESKFNRQVVFRTALKFAYYHYAKSLAATTEHDQQKFFVKAAVQLAAAIVVLNNQRKRELFFSQASLHQALATLPEAEWLLPILANATPHCSPPIDELKNMQKMFLEQLVEITRRGKEFLHFCWPNFLIYLFKLRSGYGGLNPDAYIIEEIKTGLQNNSNLVALASRMEKVVFAAVIL